MSYLTLVQVDFNCYYFLYVLHVSRWFKYMYIQLCGGPHYRLIIDISGYGACVRIDVTRQSLSVYIQWIAARWYIARLCVVVHWHDINDNISWRHAMRNSFIFLICVCDNAAMSITYYNTADQSITCVLNWNRTILGHLYFLFVCGNTGINHKFPYKQVNVCWTLSKFTYLVTSAKIE